MGKTGKKILGAIVAVAAIVFTGGTAGVLATIGRALVTAAVSIGISRLIAKRTDVPADAGGDAGARIQLPPATTNKLPVVYGSAFVGGAITDAMLSTDQKTMWYVVALAEVSDDQGGGSGSYTYDTSKFYYDGKRVIFGSDGAVDALETNNSTGQTDTRMAGKLFIYTFVNGSSSNVNNNHPYTAAQILSTTNGVPAAQAWGANQTMTNCAFAIVKVIYSTDAGTTGVGGLTVKITNSITKPGESILDYMLNERYGCALPLSSIDTQSLIDLDVYSDDLIDYKPVGWNTGDPYSQQARYRINGPLDTGQNCLNNLQFLVDSCDSWLQYSELTGKWRVVMNKGYDQTPNAQTLNDLFLVDSSNLIGGIDVSPIDLNETYNQIEVGYPNTNIKDQTDYQIIDLFDTDPQLLSANEAINRLNITLPLVNNAVQAKYLAARRLYQSREDLVISFRMDFSGIQIEAGDIIRVTHEVYGWTDKLFRVSSVAEEKDANGNLFAAIQAFEYSNGIFADIVQDYVPAFNTGLVDPNVISVPGTPTIAQSTAANGVITSFDVVSYVPDSGLVLYMDFNYGNTSNVQTHRLYRTIQQSNGAPFTNSDSANSVYNNVSVNVNDLTSGNYYWSVTARNNTSGKRSNSSVVIDWGGANIVPPTNDYICNVSSNGTTFTHDASSNVIVGAVVTKISGNGTLSNAGLTYVAQIISNTQFTSSLAPSVDLSNACIQLQAGGIVPGIIQQDSVNWTEINKDATPLFRTVGIINPPVYANGTLFGFNNIQSNTYDPTAWTSFYMSENSVYNQGYTYPWHQGTSTTANGYLANSTSFYTPGNAAFISNPPQSDRWYEAVRIDITPGANQLNLYGILNISTQWATYDDDAMIQILPYYKTNGNANHIANTYTMSTVILSAEIPTTFQYTFLLPRISNVTLNDGTYVDRVGWYVRLLSNSYVGCVYNYNEFYAGKQFAMAWPSVIN